MELAASQTSKLTTNSPEQTSGSENNHDRFMLKIFLLIKAHQEKFSKSLELPFLHWICSLSSILNIKCIHKFFVHIFDVINKEIDLYLIIITKHLPCLTISKTKETKSWWKGPKSYIRLHKLINLRKMGSFHLINLEELEINWPKFVQGGSGCLHLIPNTVLNIWMKKNNI